MGEMVKGFFQISTLSLEERISSLMSLRLPPDELKQIELISSHFHKARGKLVELLNGKNPLNGGEIDNEVNLHINEILSGVEGVMASHRDHVEGVRAKIARTEDIGKCISLAIPSSYVLLIILLVLIMGRSLIRSFGSLVSATRTMAEGDLGKLTGLSSDEDFAEIIVAFEELRKELRQKEQKLAQLSITDGLTGLFNRRYLDVKLVEEIARVRRFHHLLSIVFLDIDHFKKYNDLYGHIEGDQVLKCLATSILSNTRDKIDTAYRYGGEEFLIIVPESSTSQAVAVAERILKDFSSRPFHPNPSLGNSEPKPIYITFSAGVTTFREDEDSSEKFLNRADLALFQAKSQGRNRVVAL